jgi:hypothetical protein
MKAIVQEAEVAETRTSTPNAIPQQVDVVSAV